MADANSKKPVPHGASASSHSKAEASNDQATAKPNDKGGKPNIADNKSDGGRKPR